MILRKYPLFSILALVLIINGSSIYAYTPADILNVPNVPGVTVAVIDSGLDNNKSNLPSAQILKGVSFVSEPVTVDNLGHGSAVASIIADPNLGGSSKIKILPLKVYNNDKSTSSDTTAKAIDYAVKNKIKVISISLGGPDNSSTLTNSVLNAQAKGSIIVASMGNEGNYGALYPGAIPGVVSVGGIGQNYKSWPSSNKSANMMFSGFSEGINFYGNAIDGTSFAAPEVARVLAQLVYSNPKATTQQIINAAKNSAIDIDVPGRDDRTGYGLIDFKGADALIKGNVLSRANISNSITNEAGKTIVTTIAKDNAGIPLKDLTIDHYAFLQNTQENLFLGSSVTDGNGVSSFTANIFGNGTLFSRSISNNFYLASAASPVEFSGISGLMTLSNDTNTVSVSNSAGQSVVGYPVALWVADGDSWVNFDSKSSNYLGKVSLPKNINTNKLSFGSAPGIEINRNKFAGEVKIKPLLFTLGRKTSIIIKVSDKKNLPVAGLIFNSSGKDYITDSDGLIRVDSATTSLNFKDPYTSKNLNFKYAPFYKPITENNNSWDVNVAYPSRSSNGKISISAKIGNAGQPIPVMVVDLEILINGNWNVVSSVKCNSKGEVSFSRNMTYSLENFRVTAHTPDGLLTTNIFAIPK